MRVLVHFLFDTATTALDLWFLWSGGTPVLVEHRDGRYQIIAYDRWFMIVGGVSVLSYLIKLSHGQ